MSDQTEPKIPSTRQEIVDGKHEIWNEVVDQLNSGTTKYQKLNIIATFLVVAFRHDCTHWGLSQLPLTKENPLQTIAAVYQENATFDGYNPDGTPTFRKAEPIFGMAPQQTVFPVAAVFIGKNSDGVWCNDTVASPLSLLYLAQHGGPSYPKEVQKTVRDFAFQATETFLALRAANAYMTDAIAKDVAGSGPVD